MDIKAEVTIDQKKLSEVPATITITASMADWSRVADSLRDDGRRPAIEFAQAIESCVHDLQRKYYFSTGVPE